MKGTMSKRLTTPEFLANADATTRLPPVPAPASKRANRFLTAILGLSLVTASVGGGVAVATAAGAAPTGKIASAAGCCSGPVYFNYVWHCQRGSERTSGYFSQSYVSFLRSYGWTCY